MQAPERDPQTGQFVGNGAEAPPGDTYEVDGDQLTVQQLIEGNLRQADYTRKRQAAEQELADERAQLAAERQQLRDQGAYVGGAGARPQAGFGDPYANPGSAAPSVTGAGVLQYPGTVGREQPYAGTPAGPPPPTAPWDEDDAAAREIRMVRQQMAHHGAQMARVEERLRAADNQRREEDVLAALVRREGYDVDAIEERYYQMEPQEAARYRGWPTAAVYENIHLRIQAEKTPGGPPADGGTGALQQGSGQAAPVPSTPAQQTEPTTPFAEGTRQVGTMGPGAPQPISAAQLSDPQTVFAFVDAFEKGPGRMPGQ